MKDATPDDPQPPQPQPETLVIIRKERRCAMPGCPTTLSVYNHGYLCFMHQSEKAAQALTRFPYRQGRSYSD